MTAPVQDFETGLYLEGDQWLAYPIPPLGEDATEAEILEHYDKWEASRAKAAAILAPKQQMKPLSLAQRLTQKAKHH